MVPILARHRASLTGELLPEPPNNRNQIYDNLFPSVREKESKMAFSKRDYSAKFLDLQERITAAAGPLLDNMWAAEQGEGAGGCQFGSHVSMHFNRIPDDWWDAGARGAIVYAHVSEYEPLDMRPDVPWHMRRTDVRTRYSCEIFFFPDGVKMHCSEGTRECYSAAAAAWLEGIRAAKIAGGAAAAPDPPAHHDGHGRNEDGNDGDDDGDGDGDGDGNDV